jgi:glycosyltransferase involved in cell wall biosynthesis
MDAPTLIFWVVVLADLLALPFFAFLLVVTVAALLAQKRRFEEQTWKHKFQVLIPAHNEAAGIRSTIKSCQNLDYPKALFEIVVIADNCEDQTAALAQQDGATVLERFDPANRSKGHALKFAFDRLFQNGQINQIDALVVIDADTVVDPHLLRVFARYLEDGQDWIQAFDTVSNAGESWRTRLMTYSFGLINGVLLLGQTALGLSGGFRGNGMCFSARGLRRFPWESYGLVEDLEYSWSLRIEGERIAFAPEAAVHATMLAKGGTAAVDQRLRWEFGRRELKRHKLGPLLRSSRLGLFEKVAGAVELCMPTLIALSSLLLLSLIYNVYIFLYGPSSFPEPLKWMLLSFNILAAGSLALYGIAPFVLFPLRWNLLVSLINLPLYIVWKLLTVFQKPPSRWIRTPRESDSTGASSGESGTMAHSKTAGTEASLLGR